MNKSLLKKVTIKKNNLVVHTDNYEYKENYEKHICRDIE